MPTRRHALYGIGACAGAAISAGLGCRLEDRPPGACPALDGQRVRWVVPNAPGGGYDTESRMLQPFLEERLRATIVVDNRPGAGGLIGARAITEARPDGRTLGLLGLPGFAVARLVGQTAPDPVRDFTILGRVSRAVHVWAVGSGSPLQTLDDLLALAKQRPLVFPLNEIASVDFIGITVPAALLDTPIDLVPGFEGTRALGLAALRGDVDVCCSNFDSLRPMINAGDLRPVLQVSLQPIADTASLRGASVLGGGDGAAVRVATFAGRDREAAAEAAASLVRVIGGGRVVVGPRDLPPKTGECLSGVLADVLAGDGLRRVAGPSLDAGPAAAARADALAMAADVPRLLPFIRPSLQRLRG